MDTRWPILWWERCIIANGCSFCISDTPDSEELDTPELCLDAVLECSGAFSVVPEDLKSPALCYIALQRDVRALKHMSEKHKTWNICLAAVRKDGRVLKYVPDELKTLEICLAAVENNLTALKYVPEALKKNCARMVPFWDIDNSLNEKYSRILRK